MTITHRTWASQTGRYFNNNPLPTDWLPCPTIAQSNGAAACISPRQLCSYCGLWDAPRALLQHSGCPAGSTKKVLPFLLVYVVIRLPPISSRYLEIFVNFPYNCPIKWGGWVHLSTGTRLLQRPSGCPAGTTTKVLLFLLVDVIICLPSISSRCLEQL